MKEQLFHILQSTGFIGPELFLVSLFVLLLIIQIIYPKTGQTVFAGMSSLGFVIYLKLVLDQLLLVQLEGSREIYYEMLSLDKWSLFFKFLFAIAGLITSFFSIVSLDTKKMESGTGEYNSFIVILIAGLSFLVMADNFLIIYLAIELISISSFVLTFYGKKEKSAEAGFKYFIFGAFSSALMLYGISLVYGLTGSLIFTDSIFIEGVRKAQEFPLFLGFILILSGFLFKIASVPFHEWTPDVYEAAPYPVAALFSIAPKAGAMAVLFKFSYTFFKISPFHYNWKVMIAAFAILSLTVGNFAALFQKNAKRMLAYSSIAHTGFILLGLFALNQLAVKALMFYLLILLLMNFAAFLLVEKLAGYTGSDDISGFNGAGRKLPFIGTLAVIIMISLTGLPPTAGFYAKFLVFSALWESYQSSGITLNLVILMAGLLNTVLALFYYLRIPYYLYFRKAENNNLILTSTISASDIFVSLLSIPLLVLFFKPNWLINLVETFLN
ncbi:NADH-quinone oxidoreductase subunit N [Sporocytophaga myxococcoides]|uniref:NADH-quinone oxidoreductase subunit N n=1 Tax=Sporocytophaga myxococcoides TaxID=153721 RepID=UPI00041A5FA1|nr:NADH-quinone oxidoreductase subunit N [Sporocytophaga myxococcoides]